MLVVGLAAMAIVPGGPEAESETATSITPEIFRQGQGLAICATVLLDTCNLGRKYDRLSLAAKDSQHCWSEPIRDPIKGEQYAKPAKGGWTALPSPVSFRMAFAVCRLSIFAGTGTFFPVPFGLAHISWPAQLP